MSTSKKTCSLSIELLPEFGWSIRNQPVYGPGSVFQGMFCVCVNVCSFNQHKYNSFI